MREVERFLEALWEHKEEDRGWILLWRLKGKRSSWHKSSQDAAASVADGEPDVYVQGCLGEKKGRADERAKAEDVCGTCGLWADVDFGEPRKGKRYPPDAAAARALVDELGLRPTLVVHSGHGLQAWWLFGEIWPLEGEDRLRFARTLERWQAQLRAHAARHGWTVDHTHDLARVMRVAGTTNAKSEPLPVQILEDGGPRYQLDDFEALLGQLPESEAEPESTCGDLRVFPKANPPTERFLALLENSAKFKKTWRRRREDLKDQSASGYCCSLAHFAVQAAWTDQQIADLLVAWRRKEGEGLKADRPEWYKRTIEHARDTYRRDEVIGALSDGREIEAEDEAEARRTALEEASRLFNWPLARFVQIGRDGATYALIFHGSDGGEIRCEVGTAEDLDSKNKVRARLREKLGVILNCRIKPGEWQAFVDTRLQRIVEVEEPEAGDVVEDLRQTVLSYLLVHSIAREGTEEGWEGACISGRPFVRLERLYLSARTFRQWIARVEPVPVQFYGRLKAVGFTSEAVHAGGSLRRCWWIPLDLVREAVESDR